MRRQLIAIAAGMALGAASMVTPALAAHGGGGGGHGGGGGGHASFGGGGSGHPSFGGGARSFAAPQARVGSNFAAVPHAAPGVHGNFAANNYGHPGNWNHGHWNHGYGYGGGVYAFGGYGPYYGYGPDYYDYSDGYSNGCLQQQYVQTVYGPQLQWVDVCQ